MGAHVQAASERAARAHSDRVGRDGLSGGERDWRGSALRRGVDGADGDLGKKKSLCHGLWVQYVIVMKEKK